MSAHIECAQTELWRRRRRHEVNSSGDGDGERQKDGVPDYIWRGDISPSVSFAPRRAIGAGCGAVATSTHRATAAHRQLTIIYLQLICKWGSFAQSDELLAHTTLWMLVFYVARWCLTRVQIGDDVLRLVYTNRNFECRRNFTWNILDIHIGLIGVNCWKVTFFAQKFCKKKNENNNLLPLWCGVVDFSRCSRVE